MLVVSEKTNNFAVENAAVAQLVEHQLPKLRVAGSNPVCRSQQNILKARKVCIIFAVLNR